MYKKTFLIHFVALVVAQCGPLSPKPLLSSLQLVAKSWRCPSLSCWLRLSSSFLLLRRFLRHLCPSLSSGSESVCSLMTSAGVFLYLIHAVWVSCPTLIFSNVLLRYLIFVMCVTTLIATNQIVVLNFSLRSPSTHTMSHTIKHVSTSYADVQMCLFWSYVMWINYYLSWLSLQVFLEMIPNFLGMSPLVDDSEVTTEVNGLRERRRSSFGLMQRAEEYVLKQPRSEMMFDKQRERHGLTRSIGKMSALKLWPMF